MTVRYLFVHANIHGLDRAARVVLKRLPAVAAFNEVRPALDVLRNRPEYRHRRAGSNAITWRVSRFTRVGNWRQEIVAERSGERGWQNSEAVAVLLADRSTGKRVLHVVTHMPSKAWTVWPWRRTAWHIASDNLRQFIRDIRAEVGRRVPVVVSMDGNRGGRWSFGRFITAARPITFGRWGRYDRVFVKRAVVREVKTFATGSDHLAVSGRVVIE